MYTIGRAKKVSVLESRGIALVAYLGQITNFGSGRVLKLKKEHYGEGRDICVRDWACEKGCRPGIVWNRTGSIFRLDNEDWK